jgi:Zn-dependent protease with chaperone function
MAAPPIPYPPSPADVPDGLTDYADSYTRQQNLLLAGLFVFLIFYLGAIALFAMVGVWCVLTLHTLFVVKVVGAAVCLVFFLYLVKGFFKSHPMNKEMHIELTEDEHPDLFAFIDRLCDELDAPKPNKVFVSPDVNAAVMPRTSLVNLFVEPKKDLLIGMGLVNCVNLSEFKAVLAHEFGHFSQSAMASSYTYVASRIIGDLVDGEDWLDRFVNWCKRQDNAIKVFGYGVGGCLWVGRKVLGWLYKVITLQRLAVSREREFHADLVAVSAAGSNAVVHCLLRTEFGHQCFMQAVDDLATALDHKLYSKDLYLHQDRAAAVVRRKKKEKDLGLPPLLKGPHDGKKVAVFDADEEAIADDIPPMWRTHPRNSDREGNAKEQFVPAAVDHRSPWLLFADPADLRERMSYKFYRMYFRVPKNTELVEAAKVQEYIDNEHADTTYDPKYHGAYDDRPLEPGDLSELATLARESPWAEDRMEKVYDKLFDGCREHAEAHAELHKELHSLNANVVGKPSPKMKRKIEDVQKKLDENWEWFKSFDRRVFLLHVQMAEAVGPDLRDELVERYRFQLEVQRFYQEARGNFNKADAYIGAYMAASRGEIQVPNDFGAEVISVLRGAWKVLKNIVRDAKEINLPAMKNFAEGDRLADFILEGKMVPEPPLSELKGAWVSKLMTQLQGVKNRCFRLHFKSLGGILALQEKAAAAWVAARTPVAAEAFDFAAADTADAVEGEVLDAEAVPAATSVDEVRVEGLFDDDPPAEEVVSGEVLEVEVVDVVEAEPGGAAFVDGPVTFEVADPPAREAKAAEPAAPPLAAFAARPDGTTLPDLVPVSITPAGAAPAEEPEDGGGVFGAVVAAAEVVLDATREDRSAPAEAVMATPAFDPDTATKPDLTGELAGAEAAGLLTVDVDASTVSAVPLPPRLSAGKAAPEPPGEDEVPEAEVLDLGAADVVDEPEPAPPPAGKPAARPGFGSGVGPGLSVTSEANGSVVKPAAGRRPAVRITLVKPGDKSPFGK